MASLGWALGVTLLQPRAGYAAGVTVILNPVNQYLAEADPGGRGDALRRGLRHPGPGRCR